MNLIVEARPGETRGTARLGPREFPCALGRSGILDPKREGDGGTPAGRFPFRRLLYRADRVAHIETRLPARHIEPTDGWCDDPADRNYNREIRLPYPASHEKLWRDDHLYDVFAVLDHNERPRRRYGGSAVFLHLADPAGRPTAGCIALSRKDLLKLLPLCGPRTKLVVC